MSGVKDHSLEGRDELFLGDGVVVACDAGEEGFDVVLAVGSVEAAVETEHDSLGLALRDGAAAVGVDHLEDSERCVRGGIGSGCDGDRSGAREG